MTSRTLSFMSSTSVNTVLRFVLGDIVNRELTVLVIREPSEEIEVAALWKRRLTSEVWLVTPSSTACEALCSSPYCGTTACCWASSVGANIVALLCQGAQAFRRLLRLFLGGSWKVTVLLWLRCHGAQAWCTKLRWLRAASLARSFWTALLDWLRPSASLSDTWGGRSNGPGTGRPGCSGLATLANTPCEGSLPPLLLSQEWRPLANCARSWPFSLRSLWSSTLHWRPRASTRSWPS
mmetsp:Transcript_60179/g.193752  ORF Transcript_60179/g.193752 Transcript_60179/m.193752 type:complete len:237 (+) Transcript_60179:487-1197(+)